MKLYVNAHSKKALKERLAAGEVVLGENFSMFGGGGIYELNDDLHPDTVIALWTKHSGGNPVAKSWATWKELKK